MRALSNIRLAVAAAVLALCAIHAAALLTEADLAALHAAARASLDKGLVGYGASPAGAGASAPRRIVGSDGAPAEPRPWGHFHRHRFGANATDFVARLRAAAAAHVAAENARRQMGQSNIVPVYADVKLIRLEKVDGVEQTFDTDFTLLISWPTFTPNSLLLAALGMPPTTPPAQLMQLIVPVESAADIPNGMPNFQFPTQSDVKVASWDMFMMPFLPPWLYGGTPVNGTVVPEFPPSVASTSWGGIAARYSARFKVQLPLQNFPFDRQEVDIRLTQKYPRWAARWGFVPSSNFTAALEPVLSWRITSTAVLTGAYQYAGIPEEFDMLTFRIRLQRIPTYYLSKIVSGIFFICSMNLALFALDASDSNRVGVGSTLFLAIVTYLFLVASEIPKVGYSTRLDTYIQISMAHVFAVYLVFAVLTAIDTLAASLRQADKDREAAEAAAVNPFTAAEEEMSNRGDKPPTRMASVPDGEGSDDGPTHRYEWPYTWRRHKVRINFGLLTLLVLVYYVAGPATLWV